MSNVAFKYYEVIVTHMIHSKILDGFNKNKTKLNVLCLYKLTCDVKTVQLFAFEQPQYNNIDL